MPLCVTQRHHNLKIPLGTRRDALSWNSALKSQPIFLQGPVQGSRTLCPRVGHAQLAKGMASLMCDRGGHLIPTIWASLGQGFWSSASPWFELAFPRAPEADLNGCLSPLVRKVSLLALPESHLG